MTEHLKSPILLEIAKNLHLTVQALFRQAANSKTYAPAAKKAYHLFLSSMMEANPSSFFNEENLNNMRRRVHEDTDLRNYCEKLSAVVSIQALDAGVYSTQLQELILEDMLFDPERVDPDVIAAHSGRVLAQQTRDALGEIYSLYLIALYLLSSTPWLATWTEIFTVAGDELEAPEPDRPMRIGQAASAAKQMAPQ